jgi:hypothetical protein
MSLLNFIKPKEDRQPKYKISYQQQNNLLTDIHNNNIIITSNIKLENRSKEKNRKSFIHQEISIESFPLLPEGYEKVALFIYGSLLPYIAGLIFLFTYVSKWDYNIYLSLNSSHSYILTWCIGYEIIAGITLLIIIKNAISYSLRSMHSQTKKRFQRP